MTYHEIFTMGMPPMPNDPNMLLLLPHSPMSHSRTGQQITHQKPHAGNHPSNVSFIVVGNRDKLAKHSPLLVALARCLEIVPESVGMIP